eukprot:jgi/Chlat1/8415/Chrsp80S07841
MGVVMEAAANITNAVVHPYHPASLELPGFVPSMMPLPLMLAIFFVTVGIVFSSVWTLSGQVKHFYGADRAVLSWMIVSGLIHIFLEGAFVLRPEFYKDPRPEFFSEVWKEYAKGDSRYATRDSFVVSMEAFTAFVEGPACLAVAYAMMHNLPWRYTLQILVSAGQIYGDILYYATCVLEGLEHIAPGFLYFWFYFVFMNFIWIVVPGLCIYQACSRIHAALRPICKAQKLE